MQGSGNAADQGDGAHPLGLRHAVTSATGATFAIFAMDRVVQVAFLAVLARLLLPAEFAVAAAASLFVSLVTLAAHMGVGSALVQRPGLTEHTVLTARTMVVGAAVILCIAAEFAAPLVGGWFRLPEVTDAVRVLVPVCVIQAITFAPNALLTRRLRARDLSLIDLCSGIVSQGLVAIPLALMGWSYWALVAGALTQALVRMTAILTMQRLPLRLPFDASEARRLWSRGVGFSLTGFLQRATAGSDRLIVGRFLPATDLGLYARANGLMAFPAALYGAVADRVAFPAFARVQTEPRRLGAAYSQAIALTALVGAPVTALLVLLGPEVIRFILGPNWLGAIAPFKILAAAAYFRMADRVNGTLLRGAGRPYLMAGGQVVIAAAMIVGCLWAAPRGISAVAVVVVGASVLSYLLLTALAMRVAGLSLGGLARAHASPLAAAALVVAVVWPLTYVARSQEWSAFATLAVAGAALATVGAPALLLMPRLFLGSAGSEAASTLVKQVRAALAGRPQPS